MSGLRYSIPEWAVVLYEVGVGAPPVQIPREAVRFDFGSCGARHSRGWVCTRLARHGQRHAAATHQGHVWAVWS